MFKRLLLTGTVILAALLTTGCNDTLLLNNLSQEQANEVLAVLQQHNIASQKSGTLKEGYAISVPKSDTTTALSILNQYQLPAKAEVQISQAFPDNALISSPQAERARMLSLQEQRLEQSLKIISQVVNARVHVSYPLNDNTFITDLPAEHVSILITYSGSLNENMFISKIKTLIKNGLSNVRFEDISVVLFQAPPLQYSAPTQGAQPLMTPWLYALCGVLLAALLAGGSVLYLLVKKQRPETPQDVTPPDVPEKEDMPV
ncbi:Type III secretion apparatus [Sodalis praecaptivus]|uniref:Lipoprotein n=1 Tax=Sodalis praecaptivus TaxID=1239307 RepID=W0I170_9GAMM|nr:type III secretion inner membrane ring lipoprotein SctJ [Sodalis praecaptivus]AHF78198.1 Type III secretion apparatus [Sodalis praecaptivus]